MTEDEQIVAYVDGELDRTSRAAFEACLATDSDLAKRVAAHRWLSRQVISAYPPQIDESAGGTAMLARLGLASDNVVPIAAARPAQPSGLHWAIRGGAIAASLAMGVMIGRVALVPGQLLETGGNGQLVAGNDLARELSNRLSGEPGPTRIGMSFRTGGGVCRTFSTEQGLSGLACREGKSWVVPIVTAGALDNKGASEYQLASGAMPPAVMTEVDRRIVGEPLSPAEEAKLKVADWQ